MEPTSRANDDARIDVQPIRVAALSAEGRARLVDELYALQRTVFDGVDREAFREYVIDSQADASWLDVYRREGKAVGYLALHRFDVEHEGRAVAIFRAEAGALRSARGRTNIGGQLIWQTLSYKLRHPGRDMYFFAAPVHPSSFHGLARHAAQMWPHPDHPTPASISSLLQSFADRFGLRCVDPARPLLRHVGWITRDDEQERAYWRSCQKPTAAYFVRTNPEYGRGHGLLTLIPITASNLVLGIANFVRSRVVRAMKRWPTLWRRTEPRACTRRAELGLDVVPGRTSARSSSITPTSVPRITV